MKYRKKPVVIEAIQWDGRGETFNKLVEWVGDALCVCEHGAPALTNFDRYTLSIKTLEGIMQVDNYDFIIKGVSGEFYPRKPGIFKLTYEPVED